MKRLILLMIAIQCCLQTEAQYAQQWGLEYPWNASLNIVSTVAFEDKYAIAGSFSDTLVLGNTTLYSNGMDDVFIFILDSEGKITDAFSFGSIGKDTPTGIVCNNGKIFLLGLSILGAERILFIHSINLDSSLAIHRSFPYKGILNPDFINIDEDRIILGGSLKGILTIDTLSFVSNKIERAFIATLSEEGNILSGWSAKGDCPSRARSLVFDKNDSYALLLNTGKGSLVFPDTTSLTIKDVGSAIARLDTNNNLLWVKTIKGDGFLETTSLTADTVGYSLSVNYTGNVSTGEVAFHSNGNMNTLLVHYDRGGHVEWIREIGSDEHCRIMNVDALGNQIFCTGYYYKNLIIQGDTFCQSTEKSSFLMSLDLDGELVWFADIDHTGPDAGYGVVCDTNSVLLNGALTDLESVAYTNKYIVNNRENYTLDTLLYEVFQEAVFELVEENSLKSTVFPNPVRSTLFWTTEKENDWCLQLFDEKGIILQNTTVKSSSSGNIDVSQLSPGLYFLFIASPENSFCHRFTKY